MNEVIRRNIKYTIDYYVKKAIEAGFPKDEIKRVVNETCKDMATVVTHINRNNRGSHVTLTSILKIHHDQMVERVKNNF